MHAAYQAIRPRNGTRLPFYIGYGRAVEEADRDVARLQSLEGMASEAVDRLSRVQTNLEQWYSEWGL